MVAGKERGRASAVGPGGALLLAALVGLAGAAATGTSSAAAPSATPSTDAPTTGATSASAAASSAAPATSASPAVAVTAPSGRLAVATENADASTAALNVLRAGGNAVDAAIAAALVAGVTAPSSSGLGGGGFAMVYVAKERRVVALDFRELAPKAIDAAAFEHRPFPFAERCRNTGVPGELRGLDELHNRFGRTPWAQLVKPALDLAARGYHVSPHLAAAAAMMQKSLAKEPALARLFLPKGQPVAANALVVNAPLAKALRAVAAQRSRALYEGPLAAEFVATSKACGGAVTLEDLRDYRVIERQPLHISWGGDDVWTMPAPSAGGLLLAEVLGLFTKADLSRFKHRSPAYQHVVAEGMRGALADRLRFLTDPQHLTTPLEALLAPERMAARKRLLSSERTHTLPSFPLDAGGTHHLVTADADGNVVALTTTVNRGFGAVAVTPSGVVLNDELDDFTTLAAVKPLGLTESPNRPRPSARPVSSMTPTIVLRGGQPVLALGGSGGPTIATNVTQALLARLVYGEAPTAIVAAPRFYVPTEGPTILLDELPPLHVAELQRRGETVAPMPFKGSGVQLIVFEGGRAFPAADPRKHGSALAAER